MNVERIIYVGPSLYRCRPKRIPGEKYRPPARCGDILMDVRQYRIAREHLPVKLRQIVLIDGFFAQHLAVWHKEIVYALLKGVVVIGAASMGALRAAELHRYGMIGVGKIFDLYKNGEEDDSLVALTCDPATYKPLSEAPIGSNQKRKDALEALAFARAYKGEVSTTLTEEAMGPFVDVVLERIMEDSTG